MDNETFPKIIIINNATDKRHNETFNHTCITGAVYCTKHTKSIRIKLFEQDDLLGREEGGGGGLSGNTCLNWLPYDTNIGYTFLPLLNV